MSAALSVVVLTAACQGSGSAGPDAQDGSATGPLPAATATGSSQGASGKPPAAGSYQVTIETVEGTVPEGGSYTITLPRLAGPDPNVVDRVNAEVDDYVREEQAKASGATLTLEAGDPYIGADVLSLSFGGDWYVPGAAHPSKIASGLVFDLRNGDRIAIQDVFTDTNSGLRRLQPVVRAQLESRFPGAEAFDVVTEPVPSNYDEFVVNQSGLVVIVVDLPYVFGPQSVVVPWDGIVDLVRPKLVGVLRSSTTRP